MTYSIPHHVHCPHSILTHCHHFSERLQCQEIVILHTNDHKSDFFYNLKGHASYLLMRHTVSYNYLFWTSILLDTIMNSWFTVQHTTEYIVGGSKKRTMYKCWEHLFYRLRSICSHSHPVTLHRTQSIKWTSDATHVTFFLSLKHLSSPIWLTTWNYFIWRTPSRTTLSRTTLSRMPLQNMDGLSVGKALV